MQEIQKTLRFLIQLVYRTLFFSETARWIALMEFSIDQLKFADKF